MRLTTTLHTSTRLAGVLFVAAGLLVGLADFARSAAGNCTVAPAAAAVDAVEADLLPLVNDHRRQQPTALPTLAQSDTLHKAAAWMSMDSARRRRSPSNHIDTLGRGIGQRLTDCGYTGFSGSWAYAENVCCNGINVDSATAAFTWWKKSPGHNANMLDPQFRYAGVARECAGGQCYWTLTLGTHPSGGI
jgi:uncharacterized protein YkwD